MGLSILLYPFPIVVCIVCRIVDAVVVVASVVVSFFLLFHFYSPFISFAVHASYQIAGVQKNTRQFCPWINYRKGRTAENKRMCCALADGRVLNARQKDSCRTTRTRVQRRNAPTNLMNHRLPFDSRTIRRVVNNNSKKEAATGRLGIRLRILYEILYKALRLPLFFPIFLHSLFFLFLLIHFF